jgi:hypothetical protein
MAKRSQIQKRSVKIQEAEALSAAIKALEHAQGQGLTKTARKPKAVVTDLPKGA